MKKIKKGSIVSRKSYNNDILFVVDRIMNIKGNEFAILKGIVERIKADAPIFDLKIVTGEEVKRELTNLENRIDIRIKKCIYKRNKFNFGRILHLDGDKKYCEKSIKYYKRLGLTAVVKNIKESKQPLIISKMLQIYTPDILIITGHDGMIKNETGFNDIYNYRNSYYFIKSVKEARKLAKSEKDLVIFAGACQSYYEAIIQAGANFASSPGRILIDFIDPLIVAEKIATTEETKYVTIRDIEKDLRDGQKGVSGIGAFGKKKILI